MHLCMSAEVESKVRNTSTLNIYFTNICTQLHPTIGPCSHNN